MGSPTPQPTPAPTGSTGQSKFKQNFGALGGLSANGIPNALLPQKTDTTTTYLTQTSAPDLASTINGLFQSLVGRYATPEEIQKYGQELLAAEKANPGKYTGETSYYADNSKRASVVGTQLTAGVNEQAFLTNLIQGTASAKEYKAGTQYLNAITSINDKFRGGYSG
jgi:hypothetical protein